MSTVVFSSKNHQAQVKCDADGHADNLNLPLICAQDI
jgi:hypothetical protein